MELLIDDITFAYSPERTILDHLTLRYDSPDVLCILGANGMGKSTLLQCIIGAFKIQAGSITVDGLPVAAYKPRDFAQKVAYIPQTHNPSFAYKVIDIVTMGRTSRIGYLANPGAEDVAFAHEQLAYLGVDHLSEKPYTNISGGERQLVMIAAALAQEPELMILDEPTAHLDFGNQYRFIELVQKLKEKNIGVLMTTHFPDHALALESTTAVLAGGRIIAEGPASEVITDASMRELYGIRVNVRHVEDRIICIPGPLKKDAAVEEGELEFIVGSTPKA